MSKPFYLKFGSGNPSSNSGLTPTMITFSAGGLTALPAPGITETPASSGLYRFTYGVTQSIVFVADGGSVLATGDRYITGVLDPVQAVDELIGTSGDGFGSTAIDPSTVIGYLKRNLEFQEGNAIFTKSTATWDIYSRGSSTLLREKALTNTTTSATKS